MNNITTTIRREPLREIVAGRKSIEYRDIKPYWEGRLAAVTIPFQLRLINGMSKSSPEVTVAISKVVRNTRKGTFDLHIQKVLKVKHWDRRREQPM